MAADEVIVLVVEDDGLIRMSLVDELEGAGLRVLEASNADEALQIMNANSSIGAIFTDIDMPGSMNGLKMAECIQQSHPNVAIMLTSGHLKIPKNSLPARVPFLPKPYEVDGIVTHIRALIAR